jgi:hypothetical protein
MASSKATSSSTIDQLTSWCEKNSEVVKLAAPKTFEGMRPRERRMAQYKDRQELGAKLIQRLVDDGVYVGLVNGIRGRVGSSASASAKQLKNDVCHVLKSIQDKQWQKHESSVSKVDQSSMATAELVSA